MVSKVVFINNISDINNLQQTANNAVAIGNFDGLHIGHLNILNTLKSNAKAHNLQSSVIIFNPHPVVFFSGNNNYLISKLQDKINKLQSLDIDNIYVVNFSNIYTFSAKQFITSFLIKALNTKFIVAGEDFVLGNDRQHINDIADFLQQNDITKIVVKDTYLNNVKVSSSQIRLYLSEGEIEQANKLLGYNFFINSIVVKGNQLGRTIGFPTANMQLDGYIHPKIGIYVVKAIINNQTYQGVANFGLRPTVNEVKVPLLEVYIFDFFADIYHNNIRVEFLHFIRGEKKFTSLEQLKEAIKQDTLQAKQYFNNG